MTERNKSKIKFVGLHAHSVYSVYDGLGFPSEHMDYAYANGSDALALTDHGSQNGLVEQVLHAKKMKDSGKKFKAIYGVEAYFHPDLKQWKLDKERIAEENKTKKGRKKKDEDTSGLAIENEEETKKSNKNIVNRRAHMILLAQNQVGLNNLFQIISQSYTEENFYRFPRIDYELLEKHSEGVIAASACLTGDTILEADHGACTIREVIERFKNGENVKVSSYDIDKDEVVYQKVLWGGLTRKSAKIIKIKMKGGKELRLTPDHKVYTNKGWIEAGKLASHENVKILSLKDES